MDTFIQIHISVNETNRSSVPWMQRLAAKLGQQPEGLSTFNLKTVILINL